MTGRQLQQARKRAGLTQVMLAKFLKVDPTRISKIENNHHKLREEMRGKALEIFKKQSRKRAA